MFLSLCLFALFLVNCVGHNRNEILAPEVSTPSGALLKVNLAICVKQSFKSLKMLLKHIPLVP